MLRVRLAVPLCLVAVFISAAAQAREDGITLRSGNPAADAGSGVTCTACHGTGGPYNYNVGAITGSTSVTASTTSAYTLNFTKAAGTSAARAGFNLSATAGSLGDPNLGDSTVRKAGNELTHGAPRVPAGDGSFSWSFNWTAPAVAGDYKFYFCNNPVNNNGSNSGDGIVRCGNLNITVTPPPPAPPVANNDSYGVPVNGSRTVAAPGVLANDTDVNDDDLTAVLGTGPVHGDVTFNPDGGFTYTPDTDYAGTDTFTYRANDGSADSGEATVTITVAANNAPVAGNNAFTATEDTVRTVAAPGVLGNDTDADADALTAVLVANAVNGNVVLSANGGFSYTPDADFHGTDTFTYQASDGIDSSNVATVTITVAATATGGGGGGGGGAPLPLTLALLALGAGVNYWRGLNAVKRRSISP